MSKSRLLIFAGVEGVLVRVEPDALMTDVFDLPVLNGDGVRGGVLHRELYLENVSRLC